MLKKSKLPSKIVQITSLSPCVSEDEFVEGYLVALCADGSLWRISRKEMVEGGDWRRVTQDARVA